MLVSWVSRLWLASVCSWAAVISVRLSMIYIITVAITVSMAAAKGKGISTNSRVGFIKAIFGEFLVKGIAVDT